MTIDPVSAIRVRKAQRRARASVSKRVQVQATPRSLEREYAKEIIAIVEESIRRNDVRLDAEDDPRSVLKNKALADRELTDRAPALASRVFDRADKFNKAALNDQSFQVIGSRIFNASVSDLKGKFVAENVALIRSVATRFHDELAQMILKEAPEDSDALARLIEDRFGVAKFNARRIAVDQINKLDGKMTRARHTSVGIRQYSWATMQDERVRSSHAALDGTIQSWDAPPSVGHPGEDFCCRCRPRPTISDLITAAGR